jgi:PKD repeat protein
MKLKGFGFLFLTLAFFAQNLTGQSIQLSSVKVDKSSPLNKLFFDYKLVKINYDQLKSSMVSRSNQHFLHLQAPDLDWNLEMFEHDIHTGDYILRLGTEHGVVTLHRKPANTPMIGYLRSARGGEARLVVAENYLAGMVEEGGASFFIEPANGMDPSLPADYLIIYNKDNIIQNTGIECGYDLYKNNLKLLQEKGNEVQNQITERNHCAQVEIAISNDFTVFQKRGSEAAVENWNTTVLTLVGTNYDNEFAHGVEFVQSASFVAVTGGTGDPWNGINDINAQLDKHQNWGQGGGYGAIYDVATNWTTKYKSGAVGLAWLSAVCTSFKYNVCSDYGGSNNCLKQLQAHELGHNFAANHDGSGAPFIMAPAVNCLDAWSAASISSINNHIASRGCLSICSGGIAPKAEFFASPTEGCIPLTVVFTDLSSNDPTQWQWTFPGGTPSTSTQRNPVVIYKAYGLYDVTLKVTNPYGNSTVTYKQYIFANAKPVASFKTNIIERWVRFTNTSLYDGTYEWDFGDGETSNDRDPDHTYADDGVYDVVLRAENDCGVNEIKVRITIVTTPVALFTADTTAGCATLKVKYTNLSSKNVTSWAWDFPGGTPSTSTLFEPVVEYKTHGVFDVRLTAKNSKYKATAEKLMYIHVDSLPVSAFDTTMNDKEVSFTNKSIFAKTWEWDFGDGKKSTELNPVHTYTPGSYLATLTVTNPCGTKTFTKQIIIGNSFSVGFKIDQSKGCVPYTVQYTNTSIGASFYQWTFPGGTPSSSTEQNPLVVYNNPGLFEAVLLAGNSTDTAFVVGADKIEVLAVPEGDYTSAVSGSDVYFTNQSKFGSDYQWDFGDGNTSVETSPIHHYAAEGEYTVRMITTNLCGSDTTIHVIAVYLIPKVDFGSDTTVLCGSGLIQFISKTSSDVKTWSWQFDGGTPDVSDQKNPLVHYDKKGTYSVKLTVVNSNGQNELVKQAYIKVISTVLCPENVFYKTGEFNDVLNNPIRKYQSEDIQVYPNPFSGTLNIHGNSKADQVQIRMLNLLGKEIYCETISVVDGQYRAVLNLDNLIEGTYLINLFSTKDNITRTVFLSK